MANIDDSCEDDDSTVIHYKLVGERVLLNDVGYWIKTYFEELGLSPGTVKDLEELRDNHEQDLDGMHVVSPAEMGCNYAGDAFPYLVQIGIPPNLEWKISHLYDDYWGDPAAWSTSGKFPPADTGITKKMRERERFEVNKVTYSPSSD